MSIHAITRAATALLAVAALSTTLNANDSQAHNHTPHLLESINPNPDSWRRTLPDTPVARRFLRVLNALNGAPAADTRLGDDVYTMEFLAFLPRADLETVLADIRGEKGDFAFLRVLRATDAEIECEIQRINDPQERLSVLVRTIPDDNHKIQNFEMNPILDAREGQAILDTWQDLQPVVEQIDTPTAITIIHLRDDLSFESRAAIGATTPMAIGNAIRYYAFGALIEHLNTNALSWDQRIPINTGIAPPAPDIEIPNSIEGSTIGLRAVVARLLEAHDPVAVDAIANFIGHDSFEDYFRLRTTDHPNLLPFLSMRDYITLKLRAPEQLREKYAQADQELRTQLLPELQPHHSDPVRIVSQPGVPLPPNTVDSIGWFASTDDLAILLTELWTIVLAERDIDPGKTSIVELHLLADNTLPATHKNWPVIGALVAEEKGILVMAWLVAHASGDRYIITIIQNDPANLIDPRPGSLLAASVLQLLDLESSHGGAPPTE